MHVESGEGRAKQEGKDKGRVRSEIQVEVEEG